MVKLSKYFKNGKCQYQDLRTELQKLAASKKISLVEDILTTIIALYVLEEKYEESSDEWNLIATKAKAWLNEAGIDKPAKWLDKVTLTVKS
jgi:dihydroneopterin aldolase